MHQYYNPMHGFEIQIDQRTKKIESFKIFEVKLRFNRGQNMMCHLIFLNIFGNFFFFER